MGHTHLFYVGRAYYLLRRYDEAIAALQRSVTRNPEFQPPHLYLAASYSELGQETTARAERLEVLRLWPHFSLERMKQTLPQKDPATAGRIYAALRQAGLE